MLNLNFSILKSKTVWGTIVAVFGYLCQADVIAVLPEKWAIVVTSIGALIGVVGARNAIAKNGNAS